MECCGRSIGTCLREGKVHSYLGQNFDFRRERECKENMLGYTNEFLEEYNVVGKQVTPVTDRLCDVGERLPKPFAKKLHSRVAKLLYLALSVRPYILVAVSFFSTRGTKSTQDD